MGAAVLVAMAVPALAQPLGVEDAFTQMRANQYVKGNVGDFSGYSFTAFNDLWLAITAPLKDAIAGINAGLTGEIRPVLPLAAALYAAVALLAAMNGGAFFGMQDMVRFMLRLAVISAIISNPGMFERVVVTPIMVELPAQLMGAVANHVGGNGPITGGAAFDAFISNAFQAGSNLLDRLPDEWSWKWIVVALLVPVYWTGVFLAVGLAFLVALSLASVQALLVAIAPLAVACALVPQTRKWFASWVDTVVGVLVGQLLITTLLALMMALLAGQMAKIMNAPAGSNAMAMAAGLIAALTQMVITALVVLYLPFLSARLTSGAWLNFNSTAMTAYGMAQYAATGASGWVGGFVGGGGGHRGGAGGSSGGSSAPAYPSGGRSAVPVFAGRANGGHYAP